MRALVLSVPAGSDPNEDAAGVLGETAVVVDGAGVPARFRAGCRHSVAWYSHQLAARFLHCAIDAPDLRSALAAAIVEVRGLHEGECDLERGGPSATIAAARVREGRVEHLVLCDCSVLIRRTDGTVTRITDDRIDRIRPAEPTAEAVEALRNHPDGFWVARHEEEAAHQALVGSLPIGQVRRIHLVSDGITRAIELLGTHSAMQLEADLAVDAPGFVRGLRAGEATLERPRRPRKVHDDATVVTVRTRV